MTFGVQQRVWQEAKATSRSRPHRVHLCRDPTLKVLVPCWKTPTNYLSDKRIRFLTWGLVCVNPESIDNHNCFVEASFKFMKFMHTFACFRSWRFEAAASKVQSCLNLNSARQKDFARESLMDLESAWPCTFHEVLSWRRFYIFDGMWMPCSCGPSENQC